MMRTLDLLHLAVKPDDTYNTYLSGQLKFHFLSSIYFVLVFWYIVR